MKNKMIKNIISMMLLSSVFMLTACTGKDTNDQVDDVIEAEDNTEEEDFSISYPLVIKVGYSTSTEDPRGIAIEQFKNDVEKGTDNNVQVAIYPSGELGSDAELIAGMIAKDVDMTVSSAGNYAAYATRIGVSALPFLFEDFDDAWRFIDSDTMQNINPELEQYNMHVLAYFDNGFRCVTTSEKVGPIEKVEDMSELNIRTPDNQIVMETMSELSANPRSFPFADLKQALIDGTFDAQENPIPVIYNNKLYEVQKYLSITNHSYDAMPFTIRNDIWQQFPDNYKKVIEKAAIDAQNTNRKLVKEQTEAYVSKLEEEGMVVNYPDLTEFKSATNGVLSVFHNVYGENLINAVKLIQ